MKNSIKNLLKIVYKFEDIIIEFSKKYSIDILRVAIAIIFIWFGVLKLFWLSPADDLVVKTVFWFDPSWFIPLLGLWEVIIGVCFLFPKLLRVGILLIIPQMMGTFLPLIILPQITFQNSIFIPTLVGQYIIKNLVLISAAFVVAGFTLKSINLKGSVNRAKLSSVKARKRHSRR